MVRSKKRLTAFCLFVAALPACGSSDDDGTSDGELGTPTATATTTSSSPSPTTTSTVDPGTPGVNPYDNVYANCNLATAYGGDELCLVTPDPSDGFQLHYGPADYDDPAAVAWFLVPPGGETNDSLPLTTPNTTEVFFDEYHSRLRPGTHHLILWANDPNATGSGPLAGRRFLLGAQAALGEGGGKKDMPPLDEDIPSENVGLAYRLSALTPISFNLHYVNATEETILREGWVNIHYAAPDSVQQIADPITFFGNVGLNVPAFSQKIESASCTMPAGVDSLRVLSITGHMHAHGVRFSAWHVTAAGASTLVYETTNWSEPGELFYDSTHTNPAPGTAGASTVGTSGLFNMNAGDRIDYECDFVNDLDTALTFGNEAYTAEMCLLFGNYTPSTGGSWGCFGI